MRISTLQMQLNGVNAIIEQQIKASKTQQQLATGKRIISPSDDPAGAARILELNETIAANEQFQENAGTAQARLNLEESAISNVENIIQRVRELTIQGNNDSQTNETRQGIALELRQRLDELISLANTRDANGEYIFAGFQGLTQPFSRTSGNTFSYSGDDGQRFVQIGPSRQVAIGDSGTQVFRAIRNGNGTFTAADNLNNTGSGIIDPGTVTNPTLYDKDTYTVVLGNQTNVIGGAIGINDANANDVLTYELRINGTLVYTGAEGSTRTQGQLAADINTQMGVTGVQAFVDNGVLFLANTTPTGQPITVAETLVGATEDTDTVTGYFGSSLTGLTTPTATVTLAAPATGYVVLDSANNIETSGTYQSEGVISFNGIQTNIKDAPDNGDRFTLAPSNNQDIFTNIQNIITALETGGGSSGNIAAFHNAVNRGLVDLDRTQDKLLSIRAGLGGRLKSIENQQGINEDFILNLKETRSNIKDLDFASAISQLNLELVTLEAAQQSFIQVQGLSLFNFL